MSLSLATCEGTAFPMTSFNKPGSNNPRACRVRDAAGSSYCCVVELLSHVLLFVTMDCTPPGPSVHGILQARILE